MSTDVLGLPCYALPACNWAMSVCHARSTGTKVPMNVMPFCLEFLKIDKGYVYLLESQLCQRATVRSQALWMPPEVCCGGALLRVCSSLPGICLCEKLSVDFGGSSRGPETLWVASCPDIITGRGLWLEPGSGSLPLALMTCVPVARC